MAASARCGLPACPSCLRDIHACSCEYAYWTSFSRTASQCRARVFWTVRCSAVQPSVLFVQLSTGGFLRSCIAPRLATAQRCGGDASAPLDVEGRAPVFGYARQLIRERLPAALRADDDLDTAPRVHVLSGRADRLPALLDALHAAFYELATPPRLLDLCRAALDRPATAALAIERLTGGVYVARQS